MSTNTPGTARSTLPRVWRKLFWPSLLVPFAIVAAAMGVTWWMKGFGKLGPYSILMAMSPPAAIVVGTRIAALRQASLRRTVCRTRGLVCTECGFDLSGSTGQARCPECGVEYEAARVQEAWKACGFLPQE
jgi:hypothetical protein